MKKKCVAGTGERTFPQPPPSPLSAVTFFQKRTELNFCPLQRGEKARVGEKSIYLRIRTKRASCATPKWRGNTCAA